MILKDAAGLKLGRPDNRKSIYKGDRRGMTAAAELMGPDVHGVYWRPAREYYEAEPDETLVIFHPVHPDELPAALRPR